LASVVAACSRWGARAPLITTLVATEARACGEALAGALERGGGIHVLATVATGDEVVSAFRASSPQVVVLQLPLAEGLLVSRAIRTADRDAKIVVFGVPNDEREIVAWAEAGVLGCLGRQSSMHELAEAIESVACGQASCSASVTTTLFRRVAALAEAHQPNGGGPPLTSREIEVLHLVAQGLSNKQIARMLSLQLPTVKNHVHRILQKLGIHSRAEATHWIAADGAR
jgi:two-component system nitrate/nitrite response regulator NarL